MVARNLNISICGYYTTPKCLKLLTTIEYKYKYNILGIDQPQYVDYSVLVWFGMWTSSLQHMVQHIVFAISSKNLFQREKANEQFHLSTWSETSGRGGICSIFFSLPLSLRNAFSVSFWKLSDVEIKAYTKKCAWACAMCAFLVKIVNKSIGERAKFYCRLRARHKIGIRSTEPDTINKAWVSKISIKTTQINHQPWLRAFSVIASNTRYYYWFIDFDIVVKPCMWRCIVSVT